MWWFHMRRNYRKRPTDPSREASELRMRAYTADSCSISWKWQISRASRYGGMYAAADARGQPMAAAPSSFDSGHTAQYYTPLLSFPCNLPLYPHRSLYMQLKRALRAQLLRPRLSGQCHCGIETSIIHCRWSLNVVGLPHKGLRDGATGRC